MARDIKERLKDAIKLLSQFQDGLESCIDQLEIQIADKTAIDTADSLALYRLREASIAMSDAIIKTMKSHDLLTGELDYQEEYSLLQKEEEEEINKYLANVKEPKPIVYPEDLTLPTRKMILDLAKIELEELSIMKTQAAASDDFASMDVALFNKNLEINKRGFAIRNALLGSDLADLFRELKDPAEEMKSMAAMLLFLYTHEKMRNIILGREIDESFYYAGANLYRHAVIMQKMLEEMDKEEK